MADTKTVESSGMDPKTGAILAWVFSPITSIIWMNDKDEFLRYHAKQSLSWGIVSLIGHLVCFFLSFLFIGLCLWPLWSILDLVVRVYGVIKASNGEKWEVPVVGNLIK